MNSTILEEDDIQVDESLLRELDKGLDDIEAGRYLSVDETFDYITKKRDKMRNERLRGKSVV